MPGLLLWVTLIVSLGSPAMAADCPGAPATTRPILYGNPAKGAIHLRELDAFGNGDADLLLIGDSLIEAWDVDLFAPRKAANLGVGGDLTQNVLWRLTSPVLEKGHPKDVLILIGTNNLTYGDAPCAIVAGINAVVAKVKRLWPAARISLVEIPPRGEGFTFRNDDRKQVNSEVRKIAGLRTINVDDDITCNWQSPCANYHEDLLHFSPAGYAVLTRAVTAALH